MMGAATGVAAIVLTPAALIAPPESTPPADALVALVVLGVFCTAAAFVFYGRPRGGGWAGAGHGDHLRGARGGRGPRRGVLGERPGAGAVAGLLLIIAGSWLSTDGRVPPGLAALFTRRVSALRSGAGDTREEEVGAAGTR